MLICPICKQSLHIENTSYICCSGHSFDIAKQGYVNLLVGAQKKGDDTMMIQARHNFLETGAYTPLVEHIYSLIGKKDISLRIGDIGCGEGRYMRALQHMRHNEPDTYIGLDVSKDAIKSASKSTTGTFVVGNAYALPIKTGSLDVIISIFSPWDEDEIYRCLKPGGIAILVSPGKQHLYQFIEMIWDTPHEHIITPSDEKYTLLSLQETDEISIALDLQSNNDISHLFKMTPYYRKAPKPKQEHILSLPQLHTQAQFIIDLAQKR